VLRLSEKRKRWIKNRETTLQGKALYYNAAQQLRYVRALNRLVRDMTDETKAQVTRLFNGQISESYFDQQKEASAMDAASISVLAKRLMGKLTRKFEGLFAAKAEPYAERMVYQAERSSAASLHASLKQLSGGLSLKTSNVPEGMEDVVRASIAENVSLIKSIPSEYFTKVTGSVMRSITAGAGIADLIPEIRKYDGQTDRRARNLALDQTRKAYNSINKLRMQSHGVKQFEWIHSGGGQHPRASHIKISGEIFSFENLHEEQAALGVPEADRGLPGTPVNCKCVMKAVVRFEE
jgi:SPP1 gp7 family putative phage head morphogenesis protein